jgi:integrase
MQITLIDMANIQFRLNKGRKITDVNQPQPIYLRYSLGRKIDFNASIGFRVLVENWDIDKQRVKNRSTVTNRDEINLMLGNLTTHFEKFENTNKANGITPSYEDAKKHYETYFTQPTKPKDLFEFIDAFIVDAKTKNNPHTGKRVTEQTIKGYEVTKTILKAFNDTQYKIGFDKITLDWYFDFVEFCNKKNLSHNYIGKHVKTVKTFLTNAVEQGLTSNESFRNKKFRVLKEESDNIYLTMDELTQLWKVDLSKNQIQERARDLFLIGAFTGLRVSDYNHLADTNISEVNGVRMVKIKTQKTGRVVAIPLHPIVDAILQKNNGQPPKKMPEQNINKNIKDVCEGVGIDGIEYIETTRGGMKVTEKKYRFQLVKTHTARRSFCTNAYLSGMSSLDIMSISGHNNETNFMKYIKVTPEQVAIKMSEHAFFKGSTALKVV